MNKILILIFFTFFLFLRTTSVYAHNTEEASILSKVYHFFIPESKYKTTNTFDVAAYEAFKKKLSDTVETQNPKKAIDMVKKASENDPEIQALCHDLLHTIGRKAYSKYGSFQKAVVYQNEFCNSGYIHGVFEDYFKKNPDPFQDLTELCRTYGKSNFDKWQCFHGIGHGLMYLTKGDLDTSLTMCSENLDEENSKRCQNGVYMEVFNLEILEHEVNFVKPDNPFEVCATRNTNKESCYIYVPTYLSQSQNRDFESILKECGRAGEFKNSCIAGVGAEVIKRNMNMPEAVFELCRKAKTVTEESYCVVGATTMYMYQNGSFESGSAFCKHAPQRYEKTCTSAVSAQKTFFYQGLN